MTWSPLEPMATTPGTFFCSTAFRRTCSICLPLDFAQILGTTAAAITATRVIRVTLALASIPGPRWPRSASHASWRESRRNEVEQRTSVSLAVRHQHPIGRGTGPLLQVFVAVFASAHLGCGPQIEFPGLGRKIFPEAVMLFFAHHPEPCLLINASGGVKNALCPERDLLISRLPRESDALLN